MKNTTICLDKFFYKNPRNKIFKSKYDDGIKPIQHALDYLKGLNDPEMHLFAEDITSEGGYKRFIVADYETILYFSLKKKYHQYENIRAEDLVKLHLDIDCKEKDIPKNATEIQKINIFNDLVQTSIALMKENLIKRGIDVPNDENIVLNSSRDGKISAHVIFNNIVFKSIRAMKFFMLDIKHKLLDDNIIDPRIYRAGNLRLLWNSKYGTDTNFEFYKGIGYNYTDDRQLFMDSLICNIPEKYTLVDIEVPVNIKIVKPKIVKKTVSTETTSAKKISKAKTKVNNNVYESDIVPIDIVKKYLDMFNIKRGESYGDWLQVCILLYCCNPSEECFELFDEWSKKSEAYDSRDECAYKWNSLSYRSMTVGTLRYLAKKDNSDIYSADYELEKPAFESIKFNLDYLTDKDGKMQSLIKNKVEEWMKNDNFTCLIFKSAYDTAKTTLLKDYITTYEPKKILLSLIE